MAITLFINMNFSIVHKKKRKNLVYLRNRALTCIGESLYTPIIRKSTQPNKGHRENFSLSDLCDEVFLPICVRISLCIGMIRRDGWFIR